MGRFVGSVVAIVIEPSNIKHIQAVFDGHPIRQRTAPHPKVREGLVRHPRWTFHFTPTSASWLNAVEGYFAKLTKRRLKRGVFRSIVELQAAIKRFLAETNADPHPFRLANDIDKIIASVKRGHQVLDSIHQVPSTDVFTCSTGMQSLLNPLSQKTVTWAERRVGDEILLAPTRVDST
jgi:transposase